MLRPTPEEVLRSISYTFDALIRPDPSGALAASYSLTVSNMLRHLLLTMDHEEEIIIVDTAELRDALQLVLAFLTVVEADKIIFAEICSALAFVPKGPAPSRAARENWRSMRGTLEHTIAYLQTLRAIYGQREDYRAVRQSIRDYLDRSLSRESKLIDGAFTLARR